jgi:hypothetical protein
LFFSVLGIGGIVNTNYLLLELRVPPEKLGASMVILLTICMFVSSVAPQLSYLSSPIPFLCTIIFLLIISAADYFLPEGFQHLPKLDMNDKNNGSTSLSINQSRFSMLN